MHSVCFLILFFFLGRRSNCTRRFSVSEMPIPARNSLQKSLIQPDLSQNHQTTVPPASCSNSSKWKEVTRSLTHAQAPSLFLLVRIWCHCLSVVIAITVLSPSTRPSLQVSQNATTYKKIHPGKIRLFQNCEGQVNLFWLYQTRIWRWLLSKCSALSPLATQHVNCYNFTAGYKRVT